MSFHALKAHFFSALNNISLFGCTTVYLPIFLLKDILVASILAIINKAAINISIKVLCEYKFSSPLGKYQGVYNFFEN